MDSVAAEVMAKTICRTNREVESLQVQCSDMKNEFSRYSWPHNAYWELVLISTRDLIHCD